MEVLRWGFTAKLQIQPLLSVFCPSKHFFLSSPLFSDLLWRWEGWIGWKGGLWKQRQRSGTWVYFCAFIQCLSVNFMLEFIHCLHVNYLQVLLFNATVPSLLGSLCWWTSKRKCLETSKKKRTEKGGENRNPDCWAWFAVLHSGDCHVQIQSLFGLGNFYSCFYPLFEWVVCGVNLQHIIMMLFLCLNS